MSDGTRRPVQVITYNDGSDATVTEILYDHLINRDNVDFLIGPMSTALTIPAVRKANETGTPIFFPGASERSLYASNYKHSFGTLIQIGKRLSPCLELFANLSVHTIETIFTNESFQIVSSNAINAQARIRGINVTKNFSYETTYTEFTPTIFEWKARPASQRPDIVAFAATSINALAFLDELRDTQKGTFDPKGVLFTNGGAFFTVQAEKGWKADLMFLGDQWAITLNYTDEHYGNLSNFAAAFKARKGRDVTYLDASSYTCGYVLEKALQNAPTQSYPDVLDAVRALDLPSLWGQLQFLPTGELNFTGICDQIQHGKLEVVFPPELATAKVIFPGFPPRPPPPKFTKSEKLALILGLTLGGALLIALAIAGFLYVMNKRYHLIFIPKTNEDGTEWGT